MVSKFSQRSTFNLTAYFAVVQMGEVRPLCYCGQPAFDGISKKPNANFGKSFYACFTFPRKCQFFAWKDADSAPLSPPSPASTFTFAPTFHVSPPQSPYRSPVSEPPSKVAQFRTKLEKDIKERVVLNVGGCMYETTRRTLSVEPDSLLAAIFSPDYKPPTDEDGAVFIDRDGEYFGNILYYLRTRYFRM